MISFYKKQQKTGGIIQETNQSGNLFEYHSGFASLESKWKTELLRLKKLKGRCTRCLADFYEIDNIGQWKCKQHAYRGEPLPISSRWPCCGAIVGRSRNSNENGCIRCDHTATVFTWTEKDVYRVPQEVVEVAFGNKLQMDCFLSREEYIEIFKKNQIINGLGRIIDRLDLNDENSGGIPMNQFFISRYDRREQEKRELIVEAWRWKSSNVRYTIL